MKFTLIKKESQVYDLEFNDSRFNYGELYREYQRALGNPRYVGHVPGSYEWVVFLENSNPYDMNTLKYFHYKKEAISFLNNL